MFSVHLLDDDDDDVCVCVWH